MIEEISKWSKEYDKVARHPLQSWAWGEFRKKTGLEVTRLVETEEKEIKEVYQITWHKIPKMPFFIGYCPKSAIPTNEAMKKIIECAKEHRAFMVKFEPNEKATTETKNEVRRLGLIEGKSLFTRFSFWLDIDKGEDNLLKQMHQKTRYNVRLAEKKGVKIVEDNDGFEDYWRLTEETTKRQGFYAHTKKHHRLMWETMRESGMGHLFKAVYEGKVLTTWILFVMNGILYYPYGASSSENREVMANNLIMWEAIKFGKKNGCKLFDLWGSLGPTPDVSDPWYGFHKFKQGYGAELVEFVGTYDLVINKPLYSLYGMAEVIRSFALKAMAKLRR